MALISSFFFQCKTAFNVNVNVISNISQLLPPVRCWPSKNSKLLIVFYPLGNFGQAVCISWCHEDLILSRKRIIELLWCMINIFWLGGGGQGWWHLQTPSPYEHLLPLSTPCFKCFWKWSLNDPHPHHSTSSILHCTPSPSTTTSPPPLKILIIHLGLHLFTGTLQVAQSWLNRLYWAWSTGIVDECFEITWSLSF